MADEELEKSVRLLRGQVRALEGDLDRARASTVVRPLVLLSVLMLFWPTFSPAGADDFTAQGEEFRADGGPVTLFGLWRAVRDNDLTALTWLILVAVLLHVALIICVASLAGSDSMRLPRVVQVLSVLFGVLYVVTVVGVHQDDGSGAFGQEGYQPSGSWLLMAGMVAAVAMAAQWLLDERPSRR